MGYQGQGFERPCPRTARRGGSRLLRLLRHRRSASARRAGGTLADRARATLEAGYRVFPHGAGDTREGAVFDTRERIRRIAQDCKAVREAIGANGEWMIDFHQRFDLSDAVRGCKAIEEYDPFLVEDPVRDQHAPADLPKLRQMTSVPLAHGEEWGHRWDFNKLVESHDIDYVRATLPNVGGITEWLKIQAMCDTHAVGLCLTSPARWPPRRLVHCLSTFPGTCCSSTTTATARSRTCPNSGFP